MPYLSDFPVPDALAITVVLALAAIVAIAISAWLVHDVAREAMKRTSPENVAAVVLALAALLRPLALYLPWFGGMGRRRSRDELRAATRAAGGESNLELGEEGDHEA